jgi:hypothetical protein
MVNIGVITINYKRPSILRLFCASIARLRAEIGIELPTVCVSEEEDRYICDTYGVYHVTYPNNPASEKWNQGTMFLRNFDINFLCVLGSDDICSTDYLRNIIDKMSLNMPNGTAEFDLLGLKRLYLYDTDGVSRGQLRCITSKGFMGVGKVISKRVLDAVDWRPWADAYPRNYGMDALLHRNITPYVKTTAEVEGVIVDCKSKDSLNKFTMFQKNRHGVEVDPKIFYNILSEEELEILDSIKSTVSPVMFPKYSKRGRTLI